MNKVTSIRNFWSLNTDEAVVTGILRSNLNQEVEVFMPLEKVWKPFCLKDKFELGIYFEKNVFGALFD